MARTKCRLGFSCAAMMQQVGLTAAECLNRETCGTIVAYTPEEEAELIRIRTIENQRIYEQIRLTRHRAAVLMLIERGNPQSIDDCGLPQIYEGITAALERLRSYIDAAYQDEYIAPDGCVTHRYNVKRPGRMATDRDEDGEERTREVKRVFWYNKLIAPTAMFAPSTEDRPVRVIHLSHDGDPRNLEAKRGIERRNRLAGVRLRLQAVEREIASLLAELHEPFETDIL